MTPADLLAADRALAIEGRPLDRVCVAQAPPGLEFRKAYRAGAPTDYAHVRWVIPHVREVCSIWGLAGLLEQVATRPDCCVISGEPVPGPTPCDPWRRRKYHTSLEGDEISAGHHGFGRSESGRRWVLLDMDKVPPPGGFPERPTPEDLRTWLLWLVHRHLPEAFQGVTFYYRWSASTGVRPAKDGISCHLWWWLDRPADGRSLAMWLRRAAPVVDTSVIKSFVQPHYVSEPVFEAMPPPEIGRRGDLVLAGGELVDGVWRSTRDQVELPPEVIDTPTWRERERADEERIEAARREWEWRRERQPGTGVAAEVRRAQAALRGACEDIVGAGEGQRHDTIKAQAYRLGRKVGAGELDEQEVVVELTRAGQAVLPTKRHAEVRRTVEQCVRNGMAAPRPSLG